MQRRSFTTEPRALQRSRFVLYRKGTRSDMRYLFATVVVVFVLLVVAALTTIIPALVDHALELAP